MWPMPPSAVIAPQTEPRSHGVPRPVRLPVVGQSLSKTHAYASPKRCGEADSKGVPGIFRGKRRRENRCQRRN